MKNFKVFFCVLLCMVALHGLAQQKEKVFMIFEKNKEYPKADYNNWGNCLSFYLEKSMNDCSVNSFMFCKYGFYNSVLNVKLDTLKNVISSKWAANQYDSTLLRLFRKKDIYIIPGDSIKDGRSKAFMVVYGYCEII